MSLRRNLLMSYLATNEKWLPYSFEYLYNDLIPTTIDSKQVKNKLKLATIYGNSVVENQWITDGNFESTSAWNGQNGTISVSNNILSYTITAIGGDLASNRIEQVYSTLANRKYLVNVKVKCPYNTTIRTYIGGSFNVLGIAIANQWTELTLIVSTTTTIGNNHLYFDVYNQSSYQIGDVIQVKEYQKIDLTQMFPFDTPTTITDNRVQAILNRGYIPYNSGELKSVDIGEFSSKPYNLFDEVLEGGAINQTTGLNYGNANNFRTKNYTSIMGGLSYTFEFNRDILGGNQYVYEYDKNYSFIKVSVYSGGVYTLTLQNDTRYVRMMWYKSDSGWQDNPPTQAVAQVCVHRTGTRTGYAPHTQPQTISFKYQGNGVGTSHNSMTIYNDRVEFTTYRALADLGTLNYGTSQAYGYYTSGLNSLAKIPSNNNIKVNILCDKFLTQPRSDISFSSFGNNTISLDYTGDLDISYTQGLTPAQFKSEVSGVMLEYQLATPQVITIPRKHLGVVDLGSLSGWNYDSANHRVYVQVANLKLGTLRRIAMYCERYLTIQNGESLSQVGNMSIYGAGDTAVIYIHDTDLENLTSAQIQAKLSGTLLFYETQDEVADIIDTIGVESGGTFTANWFSWVENQLLANNNFASVSGWTAGNCSYTVSGNVATIVPSAIHSAFQQNLGTTLLANGHKYLVVCDIKYGSGESYTLNVGNVAESRTGTGSWEYIRKIVAPTNTNGYFNIYDYDSNIRSTWYLKNVDLIDLTLAFGSSNEPTSIDDPRIQYIINQGYIPTNITGTLKSVDCEVLPNVDTKIKAK